MDNNVFNYLMMYSTHYQQLYQCKRKGYYNQICNFFSDIQPVLHDWCNICKFEIVFLKHLNPKANPLVTYLFMYLPRRADYCYMYCRALHSVLVIHSCTINMIRVQRVLFCYLSARCSSVVERTPMVPWVDVSILQGGPIALFLV